MKNYTMACLYCKTKLVFESETRFLNFFGRACPICGKAIAPAQDAVDPKDFIPAQLSEATISEYHVCGGGSHEFTEDELHEDCTVQILKCKQCGALSGAWWHGKAEAMRPTRRRLDI